MEITKVLDSYLGKQTQVALKELPKIARELGFHFDCKRAFYNRYGDEYTQIVGYVVDTDKGLILFYSGFLGKFCDYFKFHYGYLEYLELLKFLRKIKNNIIEFGNRTPSSKYKIFQGYLDFLEGVG